MSINIPQDVINQNIQNAKNWMTESDVKKHNEELNNYDRNGDGKISGIEMYKSLSDTYASEFAGNEEFLKRSEEISTAQGELYSKYTGEDGVLDAYEYSAALRSSEMGTLLDEYWEMKDTMDAMNGNSDLKGFTRFDEDHDGQVSSSGFIKEKLGLFDRIFKDQEPALQQEGLNKVLEQAQILSKFAGDDGILNKEEYVKALSSETYGASMEEYTAIKQQLKSFME